MSIDQGLEGWGGVMSPDSLGWEDNIDCYEDYCLAFDVTDAKRKRALLLYSAGVDVKKIHNTLVIQVQLESIPTTQ